MPTYDYRCEPCDERFEVTRSFADTSPVTCVSCGLPAKRVFTPVGVVFKGSGFHNTDYRKKSPDAVTKEAPSADSAAPCPASSGTGTCASCPAAAE
jgi:putative FmdB family regulatory protein